MIENEVQKPLGEGTFGKGNLALTSTLGTTTYMALEVPTLHQVSTKSNVYSFGVLLIELVNGKETFDVQGQNVELL
ncbi:unnamed protein product [Sphagnum jensenii]|uniref:Protein kinase domain-containing protein n=1 Tax=Sphagnum jensenii TaxID=128206 RepID=A0ABP0VXU5_9BRYO